MALNLDSLALDFTKKNPGMTRRGDDLPTAMHKIQTWADSLVLALSNANLPENLTGQRILYGNGAPNLSDTDPGDVYIDVLTGDVYALGG